MLVYRIKTPVGKVIPAPAFLAIDLAISRLALRKFRVASTPDLEERRSQKSIILYDSSHHSP